MPGLEVAVARLRSELGDARLEAAGAARDIAEAVRFAHRQIAAVSIETALS